METNPVRFYILVFEQHPSLNNLLPVTKGYYAGRAWYYNGKQLFNSDDECDSVRATLHSQYGIKTMNGHQGDCGCR